jgi:hypothetical protein
MKRWLRSLAVRFGWDGNPLRRAVDHSERVTMTALVAVFVLGWLLAVVVAGQAAYTSGASQQRLEQQQGWHSVQATLTRSASQVAVSSAGVAEVPGTWRASDGARRTGLIPASLNAQAGERVPIEIDRAGQQVGEPMTAAVVDDGIVFAVLSVTTATAMVLALAACCVRGLFNRRRMAGWQRDWDAVGPSWSRLQ